MWAHLSTRSRCAWTAITCEPHIMSTRRRAPFRMPRISLVPQNLKNKGLWPTSRQCRNGRSRAYGFRFMLLRRHRPISSKMRWIDERDSRRLLSSSRLNRRGITTAKRKTSMSFLRMRLAESSDHATLVSRSDDDGWRQCRCDRKPDYPHDIRELQSPCR